MARMGAAHGGDAARVPRDREPVMDSSADSSATDRRLAPTVVTGDEKDDALAGIACSLQREIDGVPGSVEVHAVQVDYAVRLNGAGAQRAIPGAVERRAGPERFWRGRSRLARWHQLPGLNRLRSKRFDRSSRLDILCFA